MWHILLLLPLTARPFFHTSYSVFALGAGIRDPFGSNDRGLGRAIGSQFRRGAATQEAMVVGHPVVARPLGEAHDELRLDVDVVMVVVGLDQF